MQSRQFLPLYLVPAGIVIGMLPVAAAVIGFASGEQMWMILGVIALVMFVGVWAALSDGSFPAPIAMALLIGPAVLSGGAFASLEWSKPRSNAPAAPPLLYTLDTLPWVVVPLAGGIAGAIWAVWLRRRLARRARGGAHADDGAAAESRHTSAAFGALSLVAGAIVLALSVGPAATQMRALSFTPVYADQHEIFAGTSVTNRNRRVPILKCWYSYTVNDQPYSSARVNYSQVRLFGQPPESMRFISRAAAERHAQRLIAAGPIVYYDPANPEDASLTVGVDGPMLMWLLGGAGVAVFGLSGLLSLFFSGATGSWPRPVRALHAGLSAMGVLCGASVVAVLAMFSFVGIEVEVVIGAALVSVTLLGAAAWAARAFIRPREVAR